MLKALVGSGMLALGPAVKACGLVLGCTIVCLMAILSLYTMRIILITIHKLRANGHKADRDGRIEYFEINQIAFESLGSWASSFCMITCQLGSCMAFLTFATSNLSQIFTFLKPWQVTLALVIAVTPLCFLRTTRPLSFTSSLGNLSLVLTIVTIYIYGFSQNSISSLTAHVESRPLVDWEGGSVMFGISLFMFSAHAEMIPIEQDAAERKTFLSLLNWSFLGITILYLQFGALVFAFFGPHTGEQWNPEAGKYMPGTIFDNLSNAHGAGSSGLGTVVVSSVRALMSITLLVQFPVSLLPCSKNIELLLGLDSMSGDVRVTIVRLLEVILIGLCVIAIPGFEFITAITGSFSCGLMAFVLPPMFYHKVCGEDMGFGLKVWNAVVCVVGIVGCAYSTAVVVMQASS